MTSVPNQETNINHNNNDDETPGGGAAGGGGSNISRAGSNNVNNNSNNLHHSSPHNSVRTHNNNNNNNLTSLGGNDDATRTSVVPVVSGGGGDTVNTDNTHLHVTSLDAVTGVPTANHSPTNLRSSAHHHRPSDNNSNANYHSSSNQPNTVVITSGSTTRASLQQQHQHQQQQPNFEQEMKVIMNHDNDKNNIISNDQHNTTVSPAQQQKQENIPDDSMNNNDKNNTNNGQQNVISNSNNNIPAAAGVRITNNNDNSGQQQQNRQNVATRNPQNDNSKTENSNNNQRQASNHHHHHQQQHHHRPRRQHRRDSDDDDDTDSNNGKNAPGAAVSISCLQWLYKNIFLETLLPDDSFETVMRKMIICAAFIASPSFFCVGIYWLALGIIRSDDPTFPALITPAITQFIFSIACWLVYFSLRSTKTNAHFISSALIFGGIVYAGLMCICVPHFPAPTLLMALAEASVLTRSEWFSAHMILCVCLYVVASYNVTFVNFGQWTLLTLPHPHRGSAVEKLVLTFLGWFLLMIMTAALYLQYVEYLRLVNKSSSTSQMGWAVASHLKKWDLAAVERTLTKYQSLPHADEVVLSQFTQIVQTIRDFSVYLPRDVIAGMLNSGESIRDSQFRSRQVAVMVIEICNFPALCDSVPSSDLSKLLRMYHDTVTSALTAHEGVVVKLSGPSLVVLWGAPRPCDRRAGQACLAALHVISAIEEDLVSKFEEEGFALSVRIGITSGKAMVGAVGSRDRAMYSANGAIVNMATALSKLGRRIRRSAVLITNTAMQEAMQEISVLRFVTREAADVCTKRVPKPELVYQIVGITERRAIINLPGYTSPQMLDKHWQMDQAGDATLKKIAEARRCFESRSYEEAVKIYDQLIRDANNANTNWPAPLRKQGIDIDMISSLAQRCRKFVADPPAPDFSSVVVIAED